MGGQKTTRPRTQLQSFCSRYSVVTLCGIGHDLHVSIICVFMSRCLERVFPLPAFVTPPFTDQCEHPLSQTVLLPQRSVPEKQINDNK